MAREGPLAGVKVLDLSRVLAGPWAGQTLADLGATVIKVESPAGDDTRAWGPPFIERPDGETAAYFFAANRGKRSIVADFNDADDLATVKDLAAEADVVIENFRVGGLARFGLDYATLSETNPGLIYASVTGFGQDGPYAERAGYDFLIQAMSGLMSITGTPEGGPMKVGVAITDIVSGLYGVIGILAALEERRRSGRGQAVDIALLDSAVAVLANQAMNAFATGRAPGRLGNAHPNIVPYQVFEVADGAVIVAVGNDAQFRRFCGVIARPELAADPGFATNADRVAARERLIPEIASVLAHWERDALLEALSGADVPAGPINTIPEAMADPQIAARGMHIRPEGVDGLRTPLCFSRSPLDTTRTAPGLGADTDAVRAKGFAAGPRAPEDPAAQ